MLFNLRISLLFGMWVAVAPILALAPSVEAGGIIPVSSRADLAANDLVDWSVLGTPSSTNQPSNPFSIASTGGVEVTTKLLGNNGPNLAPYDSFDYGVSTGGGDYFLNNYPAGTAYIGRANGDVHYPTAFTTMSLTFGQPLRGVGTDIDAVIAYSLFAFGSSYIPPGVVGFVSLTAQDSTGNVLGGYSYDMASYRNNGGNNGLPRFVGLLSDSANIKSVVLTVNAVNGNSGEPEPILGYIDELSLVTPELATATPEPASLTLFGLGLLGFAGYGWRRRRVSDA